MPRKTRSTRRTPELLTRFIDITSVSAAVSVGVVQEGRGEPSASTHGQLELTGKLDEPIRDTRDVEIVLYASDDPTPGSSPTPWIGLVHGLRPVMRPAIFISHREFDRVWSLALSGLLKHGYIVLTPPRYQSAHVLNVAFSTNPEE
jgi:hypothetical protein